MASSQAKGVKIPLPYLESVWPYPDNLCINEQTGEHYMDDVSDWVTLLCSMFFDLPWQWLSLIVVWDVDRRDGRYGENVS